MRTIITAVENLHGSAINYDIMGLRPGEKLHEDMLAATELPFTYEVPGYNLLCVRPQYSKRAARRLWDHYKGPEFNSALHVSHNVTELLKLIQRGIEDTL